MGTETVWYQNNFRVRIWRQNNILPFSNTVSCSMLLQTATKQRISYSIIILLTPIIFIALIWLFLQVTYYYASRWQQVNPVMSHSLNHSFKRFIEILWVDYPFMDNIWPILNMYIYQHTLNTWSPWATYGSEYLAVCCDKQPCVKMRRWQHVCKVLKAIMRKIRTRLLTFAHTLADLSPVPRGASF